MKLKIPTDNIHMYLPWLLVTGFLDAGLEIEHQSDHIRSYHRMLNTQPFNKYSPSSPQMLMKTVFQKQLMC